MAINRWMCSCTARSTLGSVDGSLHQKPRTKDNRSLKAPGPRQESWPSKPWPELEIPRLLGGDEDLPAHVAALLGARLLVLPGCRVRVRVHVESRMVHSGSERLSVDLVWKFKASTVIVVSTRTNKRLSCSNGMQMGRSYGVDSLPLSSFATARPSQAFR